MLPLALQFQANYSHLALILSSILIRSAKVVVLHLKPRNQKDEGYYLPMEKMSKRVRKEVKRPK